MELHIQQCQACGSKTVRNILYRDIGEPDRVFVQCANCEALVATYVIGPMGYYHHNKGYESFLRSFHRSGEFMSGRNLQKYFEARVEKETSMFEQVLQKLEERNAAREKEEK